ncbi:MAG: transketolase family protein [Bacteroidales bacterium]|nr:transketolase family protein [Bacteroidales bacterium]
MTKEYPMGKANLEVLSETLQGLAGNDRDILVVTSDSRGSGKLVPFGERFPDQIIETGIAEQNLVGVSAGLASAGKKVFAVSPACFLATRALEQIKNDIAYSDNPVKLIGISAGVSYGALGSTHHSLHDYAALRAINNLTVLAPADNFETRRSIEQANEMNLPVYIRFGKKPMPHLHDENTEFIIGKGIRIKDGDDLAIIATGECVFPALFAADILENWHDLKVRVISMHTIKPLDKEILMKAAEECRGIITVEEHSVHGGLGEACASCLLQNGYGLPFRIIGIPDEYTVSGSQSEIFNHYGITGESIAETALNLINIK